MGDRKIVKSQNECCRQGDGVTFSPPSLHLNVYGSNLLKNRLTIPSMMTRNHISNIRILHYLKVNTFKIGLERPCEPTASDFKDGIVIAKCFKNNMYVK